MKPALQLKLSHQLKLTPQLQQSIRLLQLSTIELSQEIERIVQENPLLELLDTHRIPVNDDCSEIEIESSNHETNNESKITETLPSEDSNINDKEYDSGPEWQQEDFPTYQALEDDDYDGPQIPAKPITLREHLLTQVACSQRISEFTREIITLLIDSLDEDGYLTQSLDELNAFLPPEFEIDPNDLEVALQDLQTLDPVGVGARNLQECLLIQLQAMPEKTPYRNEAFKIIAEYLQIWASHDYSQIKKLLGCDDKALQAIQKLITHLNPKPGSEFNASIERYVIPDIIIKKKNNTWIAELNMAALPRLNINRLYANILKQNATNNLSSQLTEAKWLIKNIQQRSQTILQVATAIVARQQQFFEHGEVAMRPLVLREIAETLNLHESTVSRVTTQKFMHTPRGIFELKYFFGSRLATDTGGACSATAIRALIKELVKQENTKKPLSDSKIAAVLMQQGIVVARRTITKYREILQIPPANLRKTF
ncbi:RNA polymerase, sigma 54 subunit, RpoN/SigL [Nitrosomonas sp. PY1]|uniref:RNA polymerase factor sigma-54 n=1 Tax=Nitrosomonas sp. PY1 TaxID=1803906 RepID=UPI001FC82969|nr:RNA polymerase factor sigma-54 [Nitrosomonas sp. PY1]GKS68464.1 RNA polymerase, sigma 54 subunit, RpoN/SigL [Nitrosomonas sp. PY1]